MEIIKVNGNDYKVIYKENEANEFYDYFIEKVIASFNGAVYILVRRVKEVWEYDKGEPSYIQGEWKINKLCEIEDLK